MDENHCKTQLEPEHHGGILFFSQVVPRPVFRMLPCLYVLPLTHPCQQPFRSTYLHHAMMDGCVLFLLQHHQGDDNHCCYDNAAHHESNDGTFVWTHIFCKEHLENKPRKRTVSGGDTERSKVSADPLPWGSGSLPMSKAWLPGFWEVNFSSTSQNRSLQGSEILWQLSVR